MVASAHDDLTTTRVAVDTAAGVANATDRLLSHRRFGYGLTTLLLAAVMMLTLIDAFEVVDVWGVDTTESSAATTPDGTKLVVRHSTVSRPGLASPFEVVVTRDVGFTEPLDIAIDRAYLSAWDVNLVSPSPASETTTDDWLVYRFDAPSGTEFRLVFDGRIEPGRQESISGSVSLVDNRGDAEATVEFETRIRP